MKPDVQLKKFISNSPHSFDKKAEDNLSDFLILLKSWSKKMNLISRADTMDIYAKHFIPSFWFCDVVRKYNPESLLDIGTGAGLPGIILTILYPKTDVTLIESNRKKTLFLKEVSDQLDIKPIIINDRIENFKRQNEETFDVIVSRAVTSIQQIWGWSKDLLNINGVLIVLKGNDYKEEADYINQNDFIIEEIKPELKWTTISPNLNNKLILKMRKP